MLRQIPVLLMVLVALTSLSRAEEWKKDFTTAGKLKLRVETNDADIRITSWDRKDTEARVITQSYKIDADHVRVTDHQTGDQIEIEVHKPSGIHVQFGLRSMHDWGVRIEINVPREADLNLHTGDGNILVDDVRGELHLDTSDGELEIHSANGRLAADTHDGNIRADGRFDALDLRTGDGNITAEVKAGSTMSSGWNVRSGDGNVDLRVPEGFSADLNAQTGDGQVSVHFPVTVTGSIKDDSIRGKMNGGGQPLDVHTGDGNIVLDRS
jgi:DUF4097 and DUF4098 domain-containing protein YvlB